MSILVFDTETTGIPARDCSDWSTARLVQIAWIIVTSDGTVTNEKSYIIKDDSYASCEGALNTHHITEERRAQEGLEPKMVLNLFITACSKVDTLLCHSGVFDIGVIYNECKIHNINMRPLMTKGLLNTKQTALYRSRYPNTLSQCITDNDPDYVVPNGLSPHDALYDTYLCYHLYQLSNIKRADREVKRSVEYIKDCINGKIVGKLS